MIINEVFSLVISRSMPTMTIYGHYLKNAAKSKVDEIRMFIDSTCVWFDCYLRRSACTRSSDKCRQRIWLCSLQSRKTRLDIVRSNELQSNIFHLKDEAAVALALRMNGTCKLAKRELRIKPAVKKPKVHKTT
jgi:hypothetical protein